MIDALGDAMMTFFRLDVLVAIVAAAAYGLFVGAIPGLTATMAVALIIPVTFFLGDIQAIAAIVTLEACAIFAGDIPTTLLRIPGTPASAAYVDDAYAQTRAGNHRASLGVSLLFSVTGGLLGLVVLVTAAPSLAGIAARGFSALEYFWLTLLGLSCAVMVSRGSPLKGALALGIGLLLSAVGLSAVHSQTRFTFGRDELIAGVNFIPAMIGLFGISEVLRGVTGGHRGEPAASPRATTAGSAGRGGRALLGPVRAVFGPAARLLARRKVSTVRSATIGSFVGMLPGAGADIGAWISYAASRRFNRDGSKYGHGSLEGLGDATSANNSALAGAWIPTLVFGIPGDSVTAIVIGVLLMKNLTPGPDIFVKQPTLVWGIYLTFLLANLVLLPLGFLAIRAGGLLVRIPRRILHPVIVLFCIVGAYAIGGSYFDVCVMLAMGVLGFVLERHGVPLGPIVLGILLGGKLEETFLQSLAMADSLPGFFFSRPWARVLGAVTIAVWTWGLVSSLRRRPPAAGNPGTSGTP